MSPETVSREPVAVVGLGCVLPDAPDVPSFWNNLQAGRNSIREVPADRWDPALYWNEDRAAPDKTYAKIGAFVTDEGFNGMPFRLPPSVVEHIDPSQRWVLTATREALLDAGYQTGLKADAAGALRDFDRERCSVILGNAMGGEAMKLITKRLYWPAAEAALRADPDFGALAEDQQQAILARAEAVYKSDTLPVTEDSMPGNLSNVMAGRIANVFDLTGKNFTTDAACASALAALDSAAESLRRGESDMVVWGGTDRSLDVTPYVEFSKIGALSATGSRPFDADADGFVQGEGCAILLLKRLSDAERDGDKVYGVIRGVGGSSDGKGKGITAPNPAGQVKSVVRAYEDAEIDPTTVGLVEAHGTSTPVGDPTELQSLIDAFGKLGAAGVQPGSIAVGSVKSNIGHLKSAAGAAGVLKAVLALHYKRLPPSINVRKLNPRIDWAKAPFRVQTELADWPEPSGHPRRAAVSSFGFGGTNFHVVLEEFVPGRLRKAAQAAQAVPVAAPPAPTGFDPTRFQAAMSAGAARLEAEPLVLAGSQASQAARLEPPRFAETGEGPRIRDLFHPPSAAGLVAHERVGLACDPAEIPRKLDLARKAATNPAAAKLAFNQGVFLGRGAPTGRVAFLFPGQGTQYVGMGRELAAKYEVVRRTFDEADAVLASELGCKLTDVLWPTGGPDAQQAAAEKLKLTEFTQPAVLAMDVAILRLLQQWAIQPDVVAGHSLGEYGALVAAGVLSFPDALHAVAARGREMAHVDVLDLGGMASVAADWPTVEAGLAGVEGYVLPANKNCPSQTVIAGDTPGLANAIGQLRSKGLDVQELPVSAAFHSQIVAPASKPLRRVLERLDVRPPQVQVISNVGAVDYPAEPDAIRDNLAVQVASPVEWIDTVQRMHAEGVTTFIEVGPKRALTGFVLDILKDAEVAALCSAHPKKGEIQQINELFAFLGAAGFQPRLAPLDDAAVYTQAFLNPRAVFGGEVAAPPATPAPASAPAAHSAAPQASAHAVHALPEAREERLERLSAIADNLRALIDLERRPQPSIVAAPEASRPDGTLPASHLDVQAAVRAELDRLGISPDPVVVSGISVGLPGTRKDLFAPDNWDRILRGDNMITEVPEPERLKLAGKNIVRLVKGGDGSASFQVVSDIAQVIQLAGRRGGFDIADWGVDADLAGALDCTFQYAIAAGIEALRDAGIPLQRTYRATSTGGHLPSEWKLPESLRDETGIVFASAFPGYDNLVGEISRHLADKYAGRSLDELQSLYAELLDIVADPDARGRLQQAFDREFERLQDVLPGHGAARYEFNRKFLFSVLSMGHSQLAQFIGARGPNTQVNAACASTTQAIAIAEDWIRTGRCRRVLVVGADDVTSDNLFEWIGAGFLASGAATTKARVEDAALPFDRRRHGMIVGMGAVGLVVEAEPEVTARGMRPIARLLSTMVANSAFHGSRLDVDHIAQCMDRLVQRGLAARAGHGGRGGPGGSDGSALTAADIAAETVFVSHETYTPARGGSASAEIHALRRAFGPSANQVVIANTKGFTGHPQGAGVEDAIALKCLQRGQVPPIANFRDPDPELGDLNLSKGGEYPVRYALRLAAGFGSQVAMTLFELVAREDERIANQSGYDAWLAQVSGLATATLEVANRTLRIVDQGPPARTAPATVGQPVAAPIPVSAPVVPGAPAPAPAPIPVPASPPAPAPGQAGGGPDVLARLLDLVAQKTGYPLDMLDPDLDMEADLGIDTVKQAEIFGEIRSAYDLPQEEGMLIKDYPTLQAVAGYVSARLSPGQPVTPVSATQAPTPVAEPAAAPLARAAVPTTSTAAPAGSNGAGPDVLARLLDLVAQKTGYPVDMLDPGLDMEADLGIDTVKQAEIFGEIRSAYALPQEEGMLIKDYPTLHAVAGYVSSRLAPSQASPELTARTPAAATESPAEPAGTDILQRVTQLVADKTGYPVDMLEADLDLEADLGIDTVKQAELIGEVRQAYGIPPVEGLQLKDVATLRAVADFVLRHAAPAAPVEPASSTATVTQDATKPPPTTVAPAGAVTRRVPALRPARLGDENRDLPKGTVLVVGDPDSAYLDELRRAGFDPVLRAGEHGGQPILGIVCIATRPGESALRRAGGLFDAAKAHAATLRFVLVATEQDGAHGLKEVRDPAFAAVAGLGKALHKELPDAIVRVVDLHPELKNAPRRLLDELLRGDRFEVAYGRDGARYVVDVARAPLADAEPQVFGQCIVVSGGAQGITAEILAALAPQEPHLLLLGRTDLPEEAADWAALDEAGWTALEAEAAEQIRAAGDRVTPVAVQKRMAPKRKAAEVHQNLARLQEAGAHVLYAPVDVTDADAVAQAIDWARDQWGRIDAVLHAAGMEISKALADKPREQFDAVFSVKATGWDALMEATAEDDLRWIGGFTSVAGRFGNLGQTDYSAANEYLAKAVAAEARTRGIPSAFTMAWGPWGELGMATKGSILQVLAAAGVTPIPTAAGVAAFLRELATPGVREVVIAGSLGDMDSDGQLVDVAWNPAVEAARARLTDEPERFALLDDVVEIAPGRVAATVVMDRARHPYPDDHAVDGVPFFPGVFGIEAFAEAARLVVDDDLELLGADDVSFDLPLKQLKEAPARAAVHVEVVSAEEEAVAVVACRLESTFIGPDGNPLGAPRRHFQASLRFGRQARAPRLSVPDAEADLRRAEIYPPFFHGPSFQVLEDAALGNEAVGTFRLPPDEPLAAPAEFAAAPLLVEALFQICGLRTLVRDEVMSLPAGIRSLHLFGAPRGDVRLWCEPTGRNEAGQRTFEAVAVADGVVVARLDGYAMVETGPAPAAKEAPTPQTAAVPSVDPTARPAAAPAAAPPAPLGGPSAVQAATSAHAADAAGTVGPRPAANIALPEIDDVAFAAVAVDEAARPDARFAPEEHAKYATFQVPKRAAEWLAGRLAAKLAVHAAEPVIEPDQVRVDTDPDSGAPRLVVHGSPVDGVHISITHRDGLALAAVASGPLGIDLETVEERGQPFLEEAFGADELAGLLESQQPELEATCMWAAKEAAFKRAGTGLKADLRAHHVHADGAGGAYVEGPIGRLGVRFFDIDGRVLAVSLDVFDPAAEAPAALARVRGDA